EGLHDTLARQAADPLDNQDVARRDASRLDRVQEVAQLALSAVRTVKAAQPAIRAKRAEGIAVALAPHLDPLDLARLAVANGLLAQTAETCVAVNGWLGHDWRLWVRVGSTPPHWHYTARF